MKALLEVRSSAPSITGNVHAHGSDSESQGSVVDHLPSDPRASILPSHTHTHPSLHDLLHLSHFQVAGPKDPERERERETGGGGGGGGDPLFTEGAKCSEQVRVRKGAIVGGWPGDKSAIQMRPAVYNG